MDELDELAILAVIASAPSHPYAVLEHLGQAGVTTSRSAIYRNVDALVGDGMLVDRLVPGERGPARRSLVISARGNERLAWLADRALRQLPFQSPHFAVALGAASVITPGRLDHLLKARLAGAARELTAHERKLVSATEPGRLRQERTVAHLRADVGWLQHTLASRRAG